MNNTKYILLYLLVINLVSFTLFFIDKQKAKRNKWRIKEARLHTFSFLGGVAGSILAMLLFHHKNKKPKFIIITIIALIFNLFLAYEYIVNLA